MNLTKVTAGLKKGDFNRKILSSAILFKNKPQRDLFKLARKARSLYFPSKEVEVRSVIEISNICHQSCNFCNMTRSSNIRRYLLRRDLILHIVEHIYQKNRRLILLQSGENDSKIYVDFLSKCIADIKKEFNDLNIILSLGNLSFAQYKQLRESGADRYILKFETSNPVLYKKIKPNDSLEKRLKCIKSLTKLEFKVGSGNIIGLPGQTIKDIINDLFLIKDLGLTMASSSVFIPGEGSSYHNQPLGNLDRTLNYMALMRILYPHLLIPATSALEKARKNGQLLGLIAGANTVTVHDGTPPDIKRHFPIYSLNRFTPDEKHIRKIVTRSNLRFNCSSAL